MPKQIPRAWVNYMAKQANTKPINDAAKQIEEMKAKLETQIEMFQEKTSLIKHRRQFLKTKEQLQQFIENQGSDYEEFIDNSPKRVVFKDNDRYSDSNAISISNNYLVREFVQFLMQKIDSKIEELELQIVS
jgi:exonuclease VII small subunit